LTTVQYRRENDVITEVQLDMVAQFRRHDCGICLNLGLSVVVIIFIVIIVILKNKSNSVCK